MGTSRSNIAALAAAYLAQYLALEQMQSAVASLRLNANESIRRSLSIQSNVATGQALTMNLE